MILEQPSDSDTLHEADRNDEVAGDVVIDEVKENPAESTAEQGGETLSHTEASPCSSGDSQASVVLVGLSVQDHTVLLSTIQNIGDPRFDVAKCRVDTSDEEQNHEKSELGTHVIILISIKSSSESWESNKCKSN